MNLLILLLIYIIIIWVSITIVNLLQRIITLLITTSSKDIHQYSPNQTIQKNLKIQNCQEIKQKLNETEIINQDNKNNKQINNHQNHQHPNINKKDDKKNNQNHQQDKFSQSFQLQSLKQELNFCQMQLNQCYRNQSTLREQLSILNMKNLQLYRSKESSRIQRRNLGQISLIAEDYNHLHKKYTALKIDYYNQVQKYKILARNTQQQYDQSPLSTSRSKEQHLIFGILPECRFISDEHRLYITKCLRNLIDIPTKAYQIYKYDSIHPQNPHDYIDNIGNILLIIHLSNERILGAFSQKAFNQNNNSQIQGNNRACIMDVTNKKMFINSTQIKTIVYSEDALIWGDALTIKMQKPIKLYSNLCDPYCRYWDGKTQISEFLGEQQSPVSISTYEIYQFGFN